MLPHLGKSVQHVEHSIKPSMQYFQFYHFGFSLEILIFYSFF
jgi:hypothetical protein